MRIVIVGGVAGGMSCAARARRLAEDAEIIILEKGADVSVASCGLPYHVSGEIADESALLVQTPEKLRDALNLDVRINTEALEVDPQRKVVRARGPQGEEWIDYDALILSPGARSIVLPIPGADLPLVHTLRSIDDARGLRERLAQGAKSAIVIGAGFIGIEAAENLSNAGLKVSLLEAGSHVLMPMDEEMVTPVRDELRAHGIDVYESAEAVRIEESGEGGTVHFADGSTLSADIILSAVGTRADISLAESAGVEAPGAFDTDEYGRTSVEGIWAIGDATLSTHAVSGVRRPVQLAGPANRGGRLVADHVVATLSDKKDGMTRPMPKPHATAIIRVGNLQVAMTGANRRDLETAGIKYTALHAYLNNHVGYFPGAEQMQLLMYIDDDGKILGAQGVGRQGIDRRIDVVATAMRAGMRVDDLIDLDLCYAPPYGAAKDPINILGMMGENVLTGVLELWYPWQLEERMKDSLILDVRSEAEAARGKIPGALVIAHTELRERLDEVREAAAGRPIAVHCRSGLRSYLACRVLAAHGYTAASLSGGFLALRAFLGDRQRDVLEFPHA